MFAWQPPPKRWGVRAGVVLTGVRLRVESALPAFPTLFVRLGLLISRGSFEPVEGTGDLGALRRGGVEGGESLRLAPGKAQSRDLAWERERGGDRVWERVRRFGVAREGVWAFMALGLLGVCRVTEAERPRRRMGFGS